MTIYAFSCDDDGGFDVTAPMGGAGSRRACPRCGADSRRVFAAPMLGRTDPRVGATIDRAERSRSEPDVVRSPPPSANGPGARTRTGGVEANPAWARLPRP
jgi:hypothetical protein